MSAALVVLAPRHRLRSEQHQLPGGADLDGERLPGDHRGPQHRGTGTGSLVIVGNIVTMDDPAIAEAVLIEDGRVTAVGTRDEVLASAGGDVPVVDIGKNVAYPGFIDAHAHWIGDREYYGVDSPAEAMDLAVTRGWTSISEQWVNQERIDELDGPRRRRRPAASRRRLPRPELRQGVPRRLVRRSRSRASSMTASASRVLKIHLDNGSGTIVNWEPAELTATIGRANEAGWQVSVHSMSSEAQELVLDAFEAALGPTGPQSTPPRPRRVGAGSLRGSAWPAPRRAGGGERLGELADDLGTGGGIGGQVERLVQPVRARSGSRPASSAIASSWTSSARGRARVPPRRAPAAE